jgi:uncharacterized membrane protein
MKNKYIYVVIIIFIIIYILNFNIKKNTIYTYRNDNISNKQVYIELGTMLGGLFIFFGVLYWFAKKNFKLYRDQDSDQE